MNNEHIILYIGLPMVTASLGYLVWFFKTCFKRYPKGEADKTKKHNAL